jgi:predicted permease
MQEELESLKAMAGKNELGNLTLVAEGAREIWRWSWLETVWQDIRFSIRSLWHSPSFTITAVLVLSAGIGLNLLFFQLINVIYLKPLPIHDAESLVRVDVPAKGSMLSPDAIEFIRSNNRVFSTTLTLSFPNEEILWERHAADPLRPYIVSANWFDELGVRALRGQLFSDSMAGERGSPPIAVISERYWETRLQKDPGIIGATVRLNDKPVTIVGIVPRDRGHLGREPQIWLPVEQIDGIYPASDVATPLFTQLFGRVRPGLSLELAKTQLRPTLEDLPRKEPWFIRDHSVALLPASNRFRDAAATAQIWKIVGIGGSFTMLLLVITCANLANLVLSRAVGRVQELGVRVALGATRTRIARHLLSETAVIAILASSGAMLVAYWGTRLIAAYSANHPLGRAFVGDLRLDWRTMIVAGTAAILVTALVGLLPAWDVVKRDLATAMRDGGQQTSSGLSRVRQRQLLLAAQVFGSCLLLAVAGLMLRTLQQYLVPPGFDYQNVIVAQQYPRSVGDTPTDWIGLRQTIAQNPLIESAALVQEVPFQQGQVKQLDSRPNVRFTHKHVEPEFFRVVRMPFVAGRSFDSPDAGANPVVLSESLAIQVFGTGNAVGRLFPGMGTVVGVVGEVRLGSPDISDSPELYTPLQKFEYATLLARARTKADAARLIPALAQTMRDRRPAVPHVRLLEADLAFILLGKQILGAMLGSLAALALSVACTGIFGVVSYNVAVRRREIGIRMALGARHGSVILLMVEQLVWPVSLAIVAGLLGGVIVARMLESSGNFSPPDAPVMTAAALIILVAVAFACIVPTLRALRSTGTRVLSS